MLLRMLRQSLVKNARVTAWSLATLTACASLASLFFTISRDVGEKMSRSLRLMGANAVAYQYQAPASAGSARPWAALKGLSEQRKASSLQLDLRIGSIQDMPVAIVTADVEGLKRMTPYWAMKGRRAASGNECIMGRKLAEIFGLTTGANVEIESAGGTSGRFRLAGILESGDEDEGRVFVVPQPGPHHAPDFAYALLSVPGGEADIAVMNETLADMQTGIRIKPLRQVLYGEDRVIKKINLLVGLTLLSVLVLSSFGVTAAILSRVAERRKELALLQALGAARRSVAFFLLSEGAAVGVAAAVLGYGIGSFLSQIVVREIFHVSVNPSTGAFLAAAAVALVMALFAASVAVRQALRMETATLLKGE